MKNIFVTVIGLGMLLLAGCATGPASDATPIQGTWKGQEVRNGQAVFSYLTLAGNEFEFRGPDRTEWYRGTYTLNESAQPKQFIAVINLAPLAQSAAGKTINALYELISGPQGQATLVLTENAPGDPHMPASSTDRHARQIVFTRD